MLPQIQAAHFQLTVRCNLSCSFCGQSRGMAGCASNEFSVDQWLDFASQLREISPVVPTLTLWGGEPMLYGNFNELAVKLHDCGHQLNIVTNATQIEKSCDVLNNCFEKIFVSLDGLKEEHDAVRGSGVFDKVMENLKLLKDRKGKLVFLCTVSDVNVKKIPDLLPQMTELGSDEIVLQQLMYLTAGEIEDYRRFSQKSFKKDYPELANWQRDDDTQYRSQLNEMLGVIRDRKYNIPVVFTGHSYWFSPDAQPCRKSAERIHIRHDGEVGFCTDYFGFSAGNVKNNTIKEILSGEKAQAFYDAVKQDKLSVCRHCPWRLQ
jgi:MoaA/NifB/PqqE/SkfB family radical SAM enzyme